MQSIVIKDITSGTMTIYKPRYPVQRSFAEEKRAERIVNALNEIKHMGDIEIYLYKKGKLRKIGEHISRYNYQTALCFTEI